MKLSFKKGFSFGLTSGVITTLGLMVGLHSTTHSAIVVIGGILIIAIADALSDSLGMHVSVEYENKHAPKEIWIATISTFLSKFVVAMTFIAPVMIFSLSTAILVSVFWGLFLISLFSFHMAREQKGDHHKVIAEHLAIAVLVIIITHYVGDWVSNFG